MRISTSTAREVALVPGRNPQLIIPVWRPVQPGIGLPVLNRFVNTMFLFLFFSHFLFFFFLPTAPVITNSIITQITILQESQQSQDLISQESKIHHKDHKISFHKTRKESQDPNSQ